jgi:hypothetical protein
MNPRTRRLIVVTTCLAGLAAIAGSFAIAQPAKDKGTTAAATCDEANACILAGIPGAQHEHLKKLLGVWHGKSKMYMGSENPTPADGTCTWTVTSIFGDRFVKCDLDAEIPGMGPYKGLGFAGFDNISQKFVATWLDTMSTGIMNGVGELSKDASVLTWNYATNCPVSKKPVTVREVHTFTGPSTMTFDMYTTDPKSGKEYQCMRVEFTRRAS